ncbi:MAG: signal peptide peptidase SppA, partial [Candidatus Eisenbacteria bacterium]|nr:signal peptide peptidase SppA [Candidatus Eisenbacteria bacterium]
MKSFFRTFFAVILASLFLTFWGIVLLFIFAAMITSETVQVHKNTYLIQTLSGEIPEYYPSTALPIIGDKHNHLTAILENLEKARVDDRIRGVILQVGGSDLGFAKKDEIRLRIKQLQEAGKPVYAYSRFLTSGNYYMISGCDSILLPPEGVLEIKGLAAEAMHFKGTLDAIGVKANLDRIAEYKAAAEPFLMDKMSDAYRENLTWLLEALFNDMVGTIADNRGVTRNRVLELMSTALFNAPQAYEDGLLDAVVYWDDLEEILGDDGKWKTISGDDYATVKRSELGLTGKKRIAVVHAQGVIAGGEDGYVLPFGLKMGAASVTKVLKSIQEDRGIAGVILRIDSGGGESIASDDIGHALFRLDEKKPSVVSMVDVAASGGYMIAYQCSTVVAMPHTITGSIGSITGKFNVRGLYNKLGITKDFLTIGPMADLFSDYRDFSEEEWEIIRSHHYKSYEDWVRRIAAARNLDFAVMDTLCKGRVWTGKQALDRKLVDHL